MEGVSTMGDVVKFTNSTVLNPDGSLNEEGREQALQHLKKCVTLLEERVKEESIDGAVLLMFKDGDLAEDVMAGNIKSTSLLFVLEYIKNDIITGANKFTQEIVDDD
jgi:hypothetical protein